MDDFRRIQRTQCPDGGQRKGGCYGCPCCRRIANLNKHKKVTRKRSRHILKNKDNQDGKNPA